MKILRRTPEEQSVDIFFRLVLFVLSILLFIVMILFLVVLCYGLWAGYMAGTIGDVLGI